MVTKKASIALGLFLSARGLFPRTQNNVLSPLAVVFPFLGALMNFACYPFARLAAAITAVTYWRCRARARGPKQPRGSGSSCRTSRAAATISWPRWPIQQRSATARSAVLRKDILHLTARKTGIHNMPKSGRRKGRPQGCSLCSHRLRRLKPLTPTLSPATHSAMRLCCPVALRI